MNAARQLHDLGQSLWLDNISRGLLTSGTLGRYVSELAVTGLTSNPTIFDQAITDTNRTSSNNSSVTLNIDLTSTPQLAAGVYTGTLHFQAQATT